MDTYLDHSLDYLHSGLWAVYQGDVPLLGDNILAFDCSISRLLEWCLDRGLRVRPSDLTRLCLDLEEGAKDKARLALVEDD